ncbi:aminotransferase class V-fold PLP-dependent enzyme [Helicobacter mustelae]|uniref:Putative aminotransferase n=1 Tax=Helicobacter mustelae (strain ATCC 43772 / CCUG 25715 / CIP 103759 / LMG 18044 / NCTC 12198 / R85-136P) TaxID=679897 RepID=D3UFT4_HELM1|nr:aminotransferase class V-fold PLP-dependent enzyme [Helicobacter mustelae]CBG39355.1 putative aminotransferase [Helicobacter mustelae 12198]SQH70864.1 aminotransferase [Helicobacter mustelae]STP11992.1 aminotransferase [Helicobacter mustelae]
MKNFTATAFRELFNIYGDKIDCARESVILKKHALYFDWGASGLASTLVENRIGEILPYYANTHSDHSKHAMFMQELYKHSKKVIAKAFGLNEEFAIIACGSGASGAIKKFQELLGIYIPPASRNFVQINSDAIPLVIVGSFEHHSNEISFREGICEVYRIPLDKDLNFDLSALEIKLKENKHRKIIFSYNALSNVTGNFAPIKEIHALARKYKAIIAIDMAASGVDMSIEPSYFDACFLSPHKLLGGVGGCGILCIRKSLLNTALPPSFAGGGVVKYVDRLAQIYSKDEEEREEAGTPPILQLYRTALAYQLREEIGQDLIKQKKKSLMRILLKDLSAFKDIEIYGTQEHYGILSFNIQGISPFELAHYLSYNYQIQTRAGCSCAGPYGHDLLHLENGVYRGEDHLYGWLRISLHYTHTRDEIARLLHAIHELNNLLKPR